MLQDVSARGTWSKKCFKMWDLEQEMLQDVSGTGTWSKKCFKNVSNRGTWSKKCFKVSMPEALGARNASRCLWQRHLEQEMLHDVSAEALEARIASTCLW